MNEHKRVPSDLADAYWISYSNYIYEARAAVNRGSQHEADGWSQLAAWALVRSMAYHYSKKMEASR